MRLLSQWLWPGPAGSRSEGLVSTLFSSGASSASPRTRATWWICTEASGGWRMCTFTKEGFTEAGHRSWGQRWGHRAPPSKEWHQPTIRPGGPLCVSPNLSSVSSLSTQTPEEFLREDRTKRRLLHSTPSYEEPSLPTSKVPS